MTEEKHKQKTNSKKKIAMAGESKEKIKKIMNREAIRQNQEIREKTKKNSKQKINTKKQTAKEV